MLSAGGGAQPSFLWSEGNLLDLPSADCWRIPKPGLVALWASVFVHAGYKLSRVSPGNEHRQHMRITLTTQTLKRMDDD